MNPKSSAAPRSFTIRVPQEMYLQICDCAAVDNIAINIKVNQLLRLGLGKHVDLNTTLARMLVKLMTEEAAGE